MIAIISILLLFPIMESHIRFMGPPIRKIQSDDERVTFSWQLIEDSERASSEKDIDLMLISSSSQYNTGIKLVFIYSRYEYLRRELSIHKGVVSLALGHDYTFGIESKTRLSSSGLLSFHYDKYTSIKNAISEWLIEQKLTLHYIVNVEVYPMEQDRLFISHTRILTKNKPTTFLISENGEKQAFSIIKAYE